MAPEMAMQTASNWASPRANQRVRMMALHLVPMKEKHYASKMAPEMAMQTASNWARPRAKQRTKMMAFYLVPMKEKH